MFRNLGLIAIFGFSALYLIPGYSAKALEIKTPQAAKSTEKSIVTNLTPMKMIVEAGDSVVVRGFRGTVEYVVDTKSQDLKVEVRETVSAAANKFKDEWQFNFRREGQAIQIVVDGPSSKQIWNEVIATNAAPEYFIKIIGPSLPLHVNWNEGRVTAVNLQSDVEITSLKSDIIITKGVGRLEVSNQEGSVTVREHKGDVKVDSYLARVRLENIEGKIDLENFTGETLVDNITGDVNLSSFKGTTKLASIKGHLDFKNGNSPLHIEKFQGEIRGRTGQGPIFADVLGDADIHMESAEGDVNLRLPASGAWVNLSTEEGSLAVPNFLKLTRLQSQQIRSGRLHGSSGGSVFVKTTSGDIRLR
jgi:hypothetical protein